MPALPGHADARLLRGMSRHALVAFSINLTVGAGMIGLRGRVQALVGNYRIGGHRRLRIVDRAHRTVLRRGRESLQSLGRATALRFGSNGAGFTVGPASAGQRVHVSRAVVVMT
jgi:hypothetical protein